MTLTELQLRREYLKELEKAHEIIKYLEYIAPIDVQMEDEFTLIDSHLGSIISRFYNSIINKEKQLIETK